MRRTKNLKLPNGFGSIVYLGDNRRRPYGALKTVGWTPTGKQIKKYVGYETSYNKAYELLLHYNGNEYNLEYKDITVQDIYDKLLLTMESIVGQTGMSESNYKNLVNAYNNHLIQVGKEKILDIKKSRIQKIINESNLKHTSKGYIKNIWQRIVVYAKDELDLPLNSELYELKIGVKEKSNKHVPFTQEEILKIYNLAVNENYTAILIMILLFTGMRAGELVSIKNSNVFIKDNYMIGGIKTEAGKNRIIPIHPIIKSFIEKIYNEDNEYLVNNENTNKVMTYDTFEKRFGKIMASIDTSHSTHDARHTFATRADECGISETNIKIIIGHSLANNVTSNVYIHKKPETLYNEILKLKYWD